MEPVIRLLGAIKAAALFAVRRPREAAILLLAALLALTFWRLNRERGHAQELAAKLEGLPPDTKQVITLYRDRIVTKWRDGPAKIEYRDRYLPPEGRVEVVTKEDHPEKPPEVTIQDKGFTKRLGGGVLYSKKVLPAVDVKWLFWRRYGLSLGVTPEFGGLGISRHVDDLIPLGFENLEMLGVVGAGWSGELRLGVGVRSNF